jgi:hypothetical protein
LIEYIPFIFSQKYILKRIESPPKTDNQFYPNYKIMIVWRLLEMKFGEKNADAPNALK